MNSAPASPNLPGLFISLLDQLAALGLTAAQIKQILLRKEGAIVRFE
jgi:hypothetical protein